MQLFADNAISTLSGAHNNSTTTLNLATGEGAKFPSPTGSDFFIVTLVGKTAGVETSWEKCKCTSRSGDALTVVRGFDGSSAASWASGTPVELRVTTSALNYIAGVIPCPDTGGSANAQTLTPPIPIASYASAVGLTFRAKATYSNTSSLTVAISGLSALSTTMGSVALPAGGLIAGNFYDFLLESATSIRVAPYDAASVNGDTFNEDITIPSINGGGQLAGFRNAVINGDGIVQQGTATTLTATPQYGLADMHLVGVTGGTSISGTVGVLSNSGFSSGIGYGAIAASWTTGQFVIKHRIEAANTKQFNGKTVIVSGKIYQDTGGSRSFTVSLGRPTTTADTFSAVTNLGTSGSFSATTGTVTQFSYSIALGATDADKGLEILITDTAANTVASKNYVISDLQLELTNSVTPTATPFENRFYGTELALCMRYYECTGSNFEQMWSGATTGGVTYARGGTRFMVAKRIAPTITTTVGGAVSFPTTSLGAANITTTGWYWSQLSNATSADSYIQFGFTASARL